MERWHAKILAMLGTFVIPFCTTMLPWKVSHMFDKKGRRGKAVLGCLMCFGGGVFFATYILHMGPEVRKILKAALLDPNHIDYPLADLMMAAGFFLVLYIEKLAVSAYRGHRTRKIKHKVKDPTQSNSEVREESIHGTTDPSVKFHSDGPTPAFVEVPLINQNSDVMDLDKKIIANNGCVCRCKDTINGVGGEVESSKGKHEVEFGDDDPHSTRSLVLMLALSLHRIFEGMSIGLKYSVIGVWNLFLAVMCHESVIGFSLGLQFVKNNFSLRQFIVTTLLCSAIMPVGVAIGTIIVEKGEPSVSLDIANGVLQAISTGTFIYVTFFEILHDEIDHHNSSQGKLASMLFGFIVMALLSAIPEPPEVLPTLNVTESAGLSNTTILP